MNSFYTIPLLTLSLCTFSQSFRASVSTHISDRVRSSNSAVQATTESEAEKLRRRARELLDEVSQAEDALHSTLIQKKKARDAVSDSIIEELFPPNDDQSVCTLADRLRRKRLASDVLVQIIERLYEREVAAKGLERVEPSIHHDHVKFSRIAEPNENELKCLQERMDRLTEAAEVLDQEFVDQFSKCDSRITHTDIMHWGGGNIAGILKEKAKSLAREHDEQFRKRQESFYEAAKRKHSKDEIDSRGWKEGDVWNP